MAFLGLLVPHFVEEVKEVKLDVNETQTEEFMPEVPVAEYVRIFRSDWAGGGLSTPYFPTRGTLEFD